MGRREAVSIGDGTLNIIRRETKNLDVKMVLYL